MEITTKTLMSLRPAEPTSGAIAASIEAVAAFRQGAEARILEMKSEKGELLLTASEKDVKAHEARLAVVRELIEDADALLARLKPKLTEVRRNEEIASLKAQSDALNLPARMANWVKRWVERYPVLAAEIASLLAEEKEITSLHRTAFHLNEQLEALGESMVSFPGSTIMEANGGIPAMVKTFGSLVRLPGVLGAPRLPLRSNSEYIPRTVDNWVQNKLSGRMEVQGTKEVIEVTQTIEAPPDDKPFWWPDKTFPA